MIYQSNTVQTHQNLHGGSGNIHIKRNLNKNDKINGLDMFAEVTLDIGASIGYHIHETDAEAYYILEGEGVFIDHGQLKSLVNPGDLCLITTGQGHGLINRGEIPLRFIAVVWS